MNNSVLPSPKKRLLKLQPGYYAIRYGCDDLNGPIATVGYSAISDEGRFEAIGMRRGGQVIMSPENPMALVFVEGGAATVALSLFFPQGSADVPVRFDVEKLTEQLPQISGALEAPSVNSLVHLSGHVEAIGDTEVAPGSWLGQEDGRTRIEGFAVHWPNRPMNVDLSYGCTVVGLGDSPASLSGGFVGTKMKMAPITLIWLELKGPDADMYELSYKARFSMSGVVLGGHGEKLSGMHARDELVGLCVTLVGQRREASSTNHFGEGQVQTFRAGL